MSYIFSSYKVTLLTLVLANFTAWFWLVSRPPSILYLYLYFFILKVFQFNECTEELVYVASFSSTDYCTLVLPSFLPETNPYVLSHFRQPVELNVNKIRTLVVALVQFKMCLHCKKKVFVFPVPGRDVTNQTLPSLEFWTYSRPGRVWVSDISARDGKNDNLFLQCISISCFPAVQY